MAAAAAHDVRDMLGLAQLVTQNAHLLVPGQRDDELAKQAQATVKASFDKALENEAVAFPTLRSLFSSIHHSSSSAPKTRSQAINTSKSILDDEPPPQLSETPLPELTTEGMDHDMVWQQLEMRGQVVTDMLEDMFGGDEEENDDDDDDDDGEAGESDQEDEEDVDMDAIDWDGQRDSDEQDDEESESEEEDSDDDDGLEEDFEEQEPHFAPLANGHDVEEDEEEQDMLAKKPLKKNKKRTGLSLDNFDDRESAPTAKSGGPSSEVDDDFFSLQDFHQQTDAGEFEMSRMMRGETGEDEDDEGADAVDLFTDVKGKSLDGDDEDDDDEEEDEEDREDEDLDAAGVTYADFFAPPPRRGLSKDKSEGKAKDASKTLKMSESRKEASAVDETAAVEENGSRSKRGVRFSESVKVKLIAPRKKRESEEEDDDDGEADDDVEMEDRQMSLSMGMDEDEDDDDEAAEEEEDDDDDDDENEGDESEDDDEDEEDDASDMGQGAETIERFKDSLFDDDDEQDKKNANMTQYEKRLMALSSQIAALEDENVNAKYWATRGEAKARDRPQNSLLEEDLEFERMGKVVPLVTEETTKSIEDLIKKRILEDNFDDVVRKRPVDPNAFLPSRFIELQDSKSNKSLAEIYEDEYKNSTARENGEQVPNRLDEELEEKHREIEELFEDLASKLDALSNARFTPKPPKAEITTVSNLPSISMESALPTAASASTMLAPEEVFTPNPADQDKSDLTPAQKRAARQKRRKQRALMHKQADKFSQGVKGDKERAVKELVGTRGVTVLGKGGEKIQGKKRKRDDEGSNASSSVGLKL
ncbi:U3 snoRNP protein [Microbotryomycetes sp. JL201]|nr:U3 snoRNP protein [Microbotryomycetes sp. JL201]